MGGRKERTEEKNLRLAHKPVSPLTLFQYIKITLPLLDKTRSTTVRFLFLVKSIITLGLIVFCFNYVMIDVIDFITNEDSQTTTSFLKSPRMLPSPGISICQDWSTI